MPLSLPQPETTELPGGDERNPELHVNTGDLTGIAYLCRKDQPDCIRRWYLGMLRDVDIVIEKGEYELYVHAEGRNGKTENYKGEITLQFKKRYTVTIPSL